MNQPVDLPERNVTLLQNTMKFIEEHPEQHNQAHWVTACGTAFCYAGHAAILSGASLPQGDVMDLGQYWIIDLVSLQSRGGNAYDIRDGVALPVDVFAAERLGITDDEAEVLFEGDRTITGLRALVDALCDGAWIDSNVDIHDAKVNGAAVGPLWVVDWLIDIGAEEM